MPVVLAAALVLAAATDANQAAVVWQPTLADAQTLEQSVVLPKGAYPLASYERYYTGFVRGGRKIIRGHLYQGGKPGIYLTPSDLVIADSGCSVVELEFDMASRRTEAASCNGVA